MQQAYTTVNAQKNMFRVSDNGSVSVVDMFLAKAMTTQFLQQNTGKLNLQGNMVTGGVTTAGEVTAQNNVSLEGNSGKKGAKGGNAN